MDEIYTPKIEYMQAAAKNAYTPSQIMCLELKMYKVFDYKITPPTLSLWTNWYMDQWDVFIEEESKKKLYSLF